MSYDFEEWARVNLGVKKMKFKNEEYKCTTYLHTDRKRICMNFRGEYTDSYMIELTLKELDAFIHALGIERAKLVISIEKIEEEDSAVVDRYLA